MQSEVLDHNEAHCVGVRFSATATMGASFVGMTGLLQRMVLGAGVARLQEMGVLVRVVKVRSGVVVFVVAGRSADVTDTVVDDVDGAGVVVDSIADVADSGTDVAGKENLAGPLFW